MSGEIKTAAELRADIVATRGGIDRFDGVQQRILDTLVFELAKQPSEIDVRVVQDLMSLLPRPLPPPPEKSPIPPIMFVDHFDLKLKRLLQEHAPDLVGSAALDALGARVTELEAENDAQRATIADLQREVERHHVVVPAAPTPAPADNVVAFKPSSPPSESGAVAEATLV